MKVVVVCSASKFHRVFSYEYENCFLLAVVKIKTNLKLAYAACCALPSNINKYKSYVHFCYITFTYNILIQFLRFLLLFYKLIKREPN